MSYEKVATWASLPRTIRGQPIVMDTDPKGRTLVYVHGNSVILRNIENPSISEVYTEHSLPVTCAKYAPSGFYVCSGDQSGKVRIWDTINEEHILKAEYEPLGGTIRDMAWSPDSQRILVVGEGRDKFAHVFMMDSGASVKGDLTGHSRYINSCDWKKTRPFRVITGAEDNKVAFYEGPPFKFKCTKPEHSKFVQSVRFSPNGELFASGGFDGKIFVYEGKESEIVKELGSPAHKGGVYGISWSPDSKQLLSASGDKTCKVWDVESGSVLAEFVIGTEIEDQQVACLWAAAGFLVSVSLSGFLNYLDVNEPGKPYKVVKGHNKPITKMILSADAKTLYTGGSDGTLTCWDVQSGDNDRFEGKGHGIQITGIVAWDDVIYTIAFDDHLRKIDTCKKHYEDVFVSVGAQPRQMAEYKKSLLIVTVSSICMVKDDKKLCSFPLSYEGLSIAVCADQDLVAVGGQDHKVHVYQIVDNAFNETKTLDHRGSVNDVLFSPCGQFLACCDSDRKVVVYNVPSFTRHGRHEWGFHNARVNCLAWRPDSKAVASGSLDTQIIVWNMEETSKHIIIKNSHPQSQINGLVWTDKEHLFSAGHDSLVKKWKVKF